MPNNLCLNWKKICELAELTLLSTWTIFSASREARGSLADSSIKNSSPLSSSTSLSSIRLAT